jgi:prepilin-type N-terminal cleavage/methylation domain-containing protein
MNKEISKKKGFTLIELLVVITIIGILAGIAFVGFSALQEEQQLKRISKQYMNPW